MDAALHEAAERGTPEDVHEALARGAKVSQDNARGETPLHVAAREGSISALRALLDRKASPGTVDSRDWTPLHAAAAAGHTAIDDVVRVLANRDAPLAAADRFGNTALHIAAWHGNDSAVRTRLCGTGAGRRQKIRRVSAGTTLPWNYFVPRVARRTTKRLVSDPKRWRTTARRAGFNSVETA